MPSRAELNLRAFAVGLDPAAIYNDSKLEQRILFLEKNSYAVTGTKPTTTFTLSGAAGDTETFTIGSQVYTMKTTLTGVLATTTLTSTGTIPADGDSIRIGDRVYVFKTTLDTGATLYNNLSGTTNKVQVLINGSAANALTNLKKAILANGTPATDYTSLTTLAADPIVNATTITSTTLLLVAFRAGSPSYVGYKISSLVLIGSTLSFTGTFFGSGVDPVANEVLIGAAATNSLDNMKDAINGTAVTNSPDVTYSGPTKRHPLVTAGAKNATTLVIAATDTNTSGALATTETFANGAFTGSTLASGVAGMIAITGDGVADSVAGVSGDKNTGL